MPSDQFVVGSGSALREHIPGLGIAPELDAMAGPVTVVLFHGPHRAIPIFPPIVAGDNPEMPTPTFNNVMCVVARGGEESYYYDVALDRINLKDLAADHQGD